MTTTRKSYSIVLFAAPTSPDDLRDSHSMLDAAVRALADFIPSPTRIIQKHGDDKTKTLRVVFDYPADSLFAAQREAARIQDAIASALRTAHYQVTGWHVD